MKDEAFIDQMLQKCKEAKGKVVSAFPNISSEQLNWKPSAKSWSIGQCLHHLIIADGCYFSELKEINEGTYKMNSWERYSPLTHTWGKLMLKRIREKVGTKMTAPGKIQPSSSDLPLQVIDDYHKSIDRFAGYISNCREIDIDKIVITSPILSIVTYTLRDALLFLMQHEHRHINQAIRVKENPGLPFEYHLIR